MWLRLVFFLYFSYSDFFKWTHYSTSASSFLPQNADDVPEVQPGVSEVQLGESEVQPDIHDCSFAEYPKLPLSDTSGNGQYQSLLNLNTILLGSAWKQGPKASSIS